MSSENRLRQIPVYPTCDWCKQFRHVVSNFRLWECRDSCVAGAESPVNQRGSGLYERNRRVFFCSDDSSMETYLPRGGFIFLKLQSSFMIKVGLNIYRMFRYRKNIASPILRYICCHVYRMFCKYLIMKK